MPKNVKKLKRKSKSLSVVRDSTKDIHLNQIELLKTGFEKLSNKIIGRKITDTQSNVLF